MNATAQSRLAPSFLPATGVLEMTYRCSHACLFCSCPWFDDRGGFDIRPELTTREWKDVIATLCRMGVCNLAFTGGEPLLRDDLFELVDFAASCTAEYVETVNGRLESRVAAPKLYLLSNGLRMSHDVLAKCKEHGMHLSMSLPGLTTFARHTQAGSYERILHWFGEARRMGVGTTVGITVTKKNLGELYETMAGALIAGADTVLLNRFMPGGRGIRHANELMLRAQDLPVMLDTAEEVLRTAGRYGSVGTELPKCLIDTSRYERLQVGTRCSAALEFFVVGPSGYTRVCNHSPVRLVHICEIDRLKDAAYWRRFIAKDYLPETCRRCSMSGECDGGCREAANVIGGSVDAPDPLLA